MRHLQSLGHLLLAATVPLAVLLAPMYLFITPEFVQHEYAQPAFPASFRFSERERLSIATAAVHYVRGRITRDEYAALQTEEGESVFDEREVQHMTDVRGVMRSLFVAQGAAAAVAVAAGILLGVTDRRRLGRAIQHGVLLTGLGIALVMGYAALDFDGFFSAFHRLFFQEGTWLFGIDESLIQLFPLTFWVDAVWKWMAVVAAILVGLYMAGRALATRLPHVDGWVGR